MREKRMKVLITRLMSLLGINFDYEGQFLVTFRSSLGLLDSILRSISISMLEIN